MENILNLSELLTNDFSFYAHKSNNNERNETLDEHSTLVIKYFNKLYNEKLKNIFDNLENAFLEKGSQKSKELFRKMLVNTFYLHDIGKINPVFQKVKMNNNIGVESGLGNYSQHSVLSSVIYLNIFAVELFEAEEKGEITQSECDQLLEIINMNAYIISKHHGSLGEFYLYSNIENDNNNNIFKLLSNGGINKLLTFKLWSEEEYKFFLKNCYEIREKSTENYITNYVYSKLVMSVLFACDYYSTYEFMNETEVSDIGLIDNIKEIYDVYKNGDIYKAIKEYEKNRNSSKDLNNVSDINILRSELFLESENKLRENIDKNVFYLEAPTGSGKSNTAFNLSFKLIEDNPKLNKIFYVYPFNTLVEQNIDTLNNIFGNDDNIMSKFQVVNSITEMKEVYSQNANNKVQNIFLDYEKTLLNRQFLNSPVILTTHVSLFNFLFGTNKENSFPLHQLANSVIVLDEIQSYKNILWGEIITFINAYAKLLNIKVIIMSATLPDLNKISMSSDNSVKLISNREKYFNNKLFKDRVVLDYELLKTDEDFSEQTLVEHIKQQKNCKILVEFIKKRSAENFYKTLIEDFDNERVIYLLTGDDNIAERKRIIEEVKANENVVLVATQVIEAGVDIDMDIGYKDISILDAEEQFLGRINRSCKKENCKVYFFNKDDASGIYKNDYRKHKDITLLEETNREYLTNKDFVKYYEKVLGKIEKNRKSEVDKFFKGNVRSLSFTEIETKMKLIEDYEKKEIFLNTTLTDGTRGCDVWAKYIELLRDNSMGYSEKMVKLASVKALMNNFIYSVSKWSDFGYTELVGNLYFIEDAEQYFTNGKFDRSLLEGSEGEWI